MTWAHYLLQVNIYLVIFYCFYKLLLSKETYFVLNRLYLVSAGILSLAIPFLRFELFREKAVSNELYISVSEINTVVSNYAILPQTQEQYDWGRIMVLIYLFGAFIYFLHFIYQLFAINQLFNNADENDAFSFLNRKSVAANLPERATIDLHEDVHIKQLHSLDVIFFEIIGIITWFNPVIYAYKKTIKNIHEYLADEAAAKFQGDKKAYAILLLSQALGIKANSLTNGFASKSLIKKRIVMLHKERSKRTAILKYGLFLPLFAVTLILSSATIRKNNQILAVAEQISLENAKELVNQVFNIDKTESKTADVNGKVALQNVLLDELIPSNGIELNAAALTSFYSDLGAQIKYPEAAAKRAIQGNTMVNFTIKNGRIIEVIPQTELGFGCEQEVESSLLSMNSNLPPDGKYSLKIAFKLSNATSEFKNENLTASNSYHELQPITIIGYLDKENNNLEKAPTKVYSAVAPIINEKEIQIESQSNNYTSMISPPMFAGGMDNLNNFLQKAIKFPEDAVESGIQGTVKLNFIIEKDGSLSNIKTERKLGFGIDEEAIRVLKLTKKWYPAMQNGKAVKVAYSIPIRFTFEQQKQASKGTIVASIRLKNHGEEEKSPLFIVDGQLKANSAVKELDAKNINKIDVLKEARAMALYGKKGENGAVVITSKKPENPKVSATIFEY
jgi:TonB family protein